MRMIYICGFLAVAAIATIASLGREMLITIERVVDIGIDFAMTPFRADYGNAFEVSQRWVLAAFQVIGLLKPEYDDALQTDGQNFERNVRLALHC